MSITIVDNTQRTFEPVEINLAMGNGVNFDLTAEGEPLLAVLQAAVAQLVTNGVPGAANIVVANAEGGLANETFILRPNPEGSATPYTQITGQADTPVRPADKIVQTARVTNG